jgi:hypothetical protein
VPLGSDIDEAVVQAVVSNLASATLKDPLPKDDQDPDLSVYGLDKPELSITVDVGGVSKSLQFGKLSEFLHQRYIKSSASSSIYMTDETLFNAAGKPRDSFRSHSPLKSKQGENIQTISLSSSEGSFSVERSTDGAWTVGEAKEKADPQFVNEFLRNLRSLHAIGFVDLAADADLSPYGLSSPDVTVSLGGSSPVQVKVGVKVGDGKDETAMYFMTDKCTTVYKTSGNEINLFRLGAVSFRDTHIAPLSRTKPGTLSWVPASGSASLRVEHADKTTLVNGKSLAESKTDAFLDAVQDLELSEFANSDEPPGRADAELVAEGEWGVFSVSFGEVREKDSDRVRPVWRSKEKILGFVMEDVYQKLLTLGKDLAVVEPSPVPEATKPATPVS